MAENFKHSKHKEIISFLDKYCPDQFEILGIGLELANMDIIKEKLGKLNGGPRLYVERDGELV